MCIKEIFNASFEATYKNENVYSIQMHFLDKENHPISNQEFFFIEQTSSKEGQTVDIYSQNGTCAKGSSNAILKHIFRKEDAKQIETALHQAPINSSSQTLFVLDLQDKHTGYLPCVECHRHNFQM